MKEAKGIDELYRLFKRKRRISLREAAVVLEIPESTALKWAKALQEDGMIDIEFKGDEAILVWVGGEGGIKVGELAAELPSEEEVDKKTIAQAKQEFERVVKEYEKKIADIKHKSRELEELEKERASIIYKSYIPLERRFEAELQLLNEQLSEKEREIATLEKRIREVPSKMAGVEEQAKKVEQIEAFAKRNVTLAKARVQAEATRMREAQALIEQLLKEVGLRVQESTDKLRLIEKELIRLKKIEHYMDMQVADLDSRLQELMTVKAETLKKYSHLRAAITPEMLRVYVGELTALKERHAQEIHIIRKKEEELNRKVLQAKKELGRLTTESKVVLEKFERLSQKKKRGGIAEKGLEKERERFERDLDSLTSGYIE